MTSISIDSAGNALKNLLTRTHLGETVTLLDDDGKPLALLVSLHQAIIESDVANAEWDIQWDVLANQISDTWNSDQSAVETLAEMRR
jgi:antitoxin (DNA-binding transcriptional repressor) of toxin-antitoxin stability system